MSCPVPDEPGPIAGAGFAVHQCFPLLDEARSRAVLAVLAIETACASSPFVTVDELRARWPLPADVEVTLDQLCALERVWDVQRPHRRFVVVVPPAVTGAPTLSAARRAQLETVRDELRELIGAATTDVAPLFRLPLRGDPAAWVRTGTVVHELGRQVRAGRVDLDLLGEIGVR